MSNVIQFDPEKLYKPYSRAATDGIKGRGELRYTVNTANRQARDHGVPGRITTYGAAVIIDLADWRCLYCGRPHDPAKGRGSVVSLDHVVPLIAGGVNNYSNVVPCCVDCNRRKVDSDLDVALERLGVNEAAFFARWNNLRGRLGMGPVTPEDVRASTLLPYETRRAARRIGRRIKQGREKLISLGLIKHPPKGDSAA